MNQDAVVQLNELLKKSDFLRDLMDTHRRATERVILSFISALLRHDPSHITAIKKALADVDISTNRPSDDSEARRMARNIKSNI